MWISTILPHKEPNVKESLPKNDVHLFLCFNDAWSIMELVLSLCFDLDLGHGG